MKIFSASQIKQWDAFTTVHEPVASIDLMERAATACCKWLIGKNFGKFHFRIFCGKGNNGGDGLAIARMLIAHECLVTIYILELGNIGSPDFQANLARLHECSTDIHFIQSPEFFPAVDASDIIIDAIFGTGLNKAPEGVSKSLIEYINTRPATRISVDLPSGMFADTSSKGNAVIQATHTLSFQQYKLAFLLAENGPSCGEVHLLHIGLHPAFEASEAAAFELVEEAMIRQYYKPRSAFAHKGNYGHAALFCGSLGMMGAAILGARSCLRSGAGKLTSFVPRCGYDIIQTAVPEAMAIVSGEDHLLPFSGMNPYNAVGIGPGIGMHDSHKSLLAGIFREQQAPLVLDADALNVLATDKTLLNSITPHSIITPHPKEFERLFGETENDFERLSLAKAKSKELNIYIVLKGHYSFISTPGGNGYFNSTGNAGMATAGSGDVLTGIITGLLAHGYHPLHAALTGVYLHGLAGDLAAAGLSKEAMIAGDLISSLPQAFKKIITA